MPLGASQQFTVNSRMRPGVAGLVVSLLSGQNFEYLVNKDPQAAEVYSVVIATATNSETYGLNLTSPVSRSISYTADGSTSKAEIADGLAAAWNADPICRGYAAAVSDGVDTVTITGVFPGVAIVIEEDENAAKMTTTNPTDAAQASTIPFGRGVISVADETDYADKLGILAKSSALTAQVDSFALTYDAGIEISAVIEVDGETYETVPFAMATNIATVAAALDAAIDAAVPANTVIATNDTVDTVIITAEVAGRPFKSYVKFGVGATTAAAAKTSNAGQTTDINKALAGVSVFSADSEVNALPSASSDDASYAANEGVTVLQGGEIWVEVDSGTSIVKGAPVYIELDGTGSAAGRFYTSGGATRALLKESVAVWERAAHSDSDANVAVLKLHARP